MQKQKKKAGKKGSGGGGEASKDSTATEQAAPPAGTEESPETKDDGEDTEQQATEDAAKDEQSTHEEEPDTSTKESGDAAEEDAGSSEPSGNRRRQASLSVQSKMRSSTFRHSSGVKSPPPVSSSPDGNTAPEVFRKQALRLEELEKENKRLENELQIADARSKRMDEQLDDLRETSGDVAELKGELSKAEKRGDEVDKLVSIDVFFLKLQYPLP